MMQKRLISLCMALLMTASSFGTALNAAVEAARAGDGLAVLLTDRAVDALGTALANLASAYNPDAIVLGGGVVKDAWFTQRVRARMEALCLKETLIGLKEFAPSSLDPERVGMLGAAALAMEVWG